jgi:hypothetical protein
MRAMDRRRVTVLGAAIALASGAAVMAVSGLGVISLVPAATTQGEEAGASAARPCACGWIESAGDKPSDADNRAIRVREYTVRMVDGSRRTFTSGPEVRWRVGEKLSLIGGEGQPAR